MNNNKYVQYYECSLNDSRDGISFIPELIRTFRTEANPTFFDALTSWLAPCFLAIQITIYSNLDKRS